jgi:hypothetical protein
MSTMKINIRYFICTLLLFATEVLIALYVHDQIIRPYIGDLLVVILIYCFVKSFLNTPIWPTAITVLLFSYTIEVLQYFDLVNLLGLQDSKLARIVIGTSFAWTDLAAYTAGIAIVLYAERKN